METAADRVGSARITPTSPFSAADAASAGHDAPEPAASSAATSSATVPLRSAASSPENARRSGRPRSRRGDRVASPGSARRGADGPTRTEETAAASGVDAGRRDHQHLRQERADQLAGVVDLGELRRPVGTPVPVT